MAINITKDHHLLTRNLKLNDNYISNDGGDEGISIADDGKVSIDTIASTLTIDKDHNNTTGTTTKALQIDLDRTGDVSSGFDTTIGIDVDVNVTGASGGNIQSYGIDIDVIGDTGGTSGASGLRIDVSGVDASLSTGIYMDNVNGGDDIKNVSSANYSDYFTIRTIANGNTTLETNDGSGSAANLNMVADGNFTVDAAGGIYLDAENGECRLTDASQGSNVFTPSDNADITTKKYVDDNLHTESHTVASHSDTTATGAELETLTDGSDASALHLHDTSKYYYSFISANFYSTSTATAYFVPLNGGILEVATPGTNNGESFAIIAPHNGILVKVMIRSESLLRHDLLCELLTSSDTVAELPETVIGTLNADFSGTPLADDTTYTYDFTGTLTSGNNVFTKGQVLGIRLDPDGGRQDDCYCMVVLKFDVTT